MTLLYYHQDFLGHETGHHPECAERLRQLHPAHQEHSTAVNDLATQIKTLTEQRDSHQVLLDNTKYHLSSNRQNLRQKQQDLLLFFTVVAI